MKSCSTNNEEANSCMPIKTHPIKRCSLEHAIFAQYPLQLSVASLQGIEMDLRVPCSDFETKSNVQLKSWRVLQPKAESGDRKATISRYPFSALCLLFRECNVIYVSDPFRES